MVITPINNGIVIDHITAGKGMRLYEILKLAELDCAVAIIMNVDSPKMGKKDIIKIDRVIDLDFDAVGYIDPDVTINIISDGKLQKRKHLELPETITGVIKCANPRCITSTEQELPQVFRLTDREKHTYRCIYCESKAKRR
ncbi:MAG: aspartate carbamoyltransferase regulatory subunit [Clostridia bacterium]|nr:aspartate carbamoyltransferase regulatory subunit [Clostridia bacterium]